ncbi:MAG TPA: mechanosensitive ion channel domain-containing protein [Puia sp.]
MFDQLQQLFKRFPDFLWNLVIILLAIGIGLVCRSLAKAIVGKEKPLDTGFFFWHSFIRRMSRPLSFYLPFLALYLMLPVMRISPSFSSSLQKLADILLFITFAGILIGIVRIGEDYVYYTYDIKKGDNLRERKIRTQLQFIRRLVMILIVIITLCFVLMRFDSLRRIGSGLLAGVGVSGIIIGFAAQKSLGSFMAGFQIAFTQPIRIDDVLVVEGEWGRVEEITLTYVVLRIWDKRSLVIPINYFIEKPFQNWTRTGADLIGTIFIYLDYTVPVDSLRVELDRLLSLTPLWNRETKAVQVTNLTDKTIEVRALVSANNSSDTFDLRCYIREGLLKFVKLNYPDSLPLMRIKN